MKKAKKKLLVLTIMSISMSVLADDTEFVVDPEDLQDVTKINPQAAVYLTSDANVRVSGMFSGQWNEKTDFAGFAEGIFGDRYGDDEFSGDYLGGRAQYFQAHELNTNAFIPRAGFSFDAIHQKQRGFDDTALVSIGAVAAINAKYTPGFQVFPNVAYTTGEVFGEDADGYLINLFMSTPVGNNGAFLLAWPEYFDVSGDNVDFESKSMNFVFQAPVNSNYSQWLVSKVEWNETDITFNGNRMEGDPEIRMELGMKWYF
ncbi:hypothetical protein Vca1114GL_00561 [Vibrio campbellii]|uniref:hypothetical protein n=1 Tax=Vibrio campbellii TaxID=680 RepID=UPI00097FA981|nr:hypothetical protein [Vibrio campbellii]AQM67082.1 hypothetical protein Vca1114GL_00561 [Vibrio campbellii]